MSKTVLTIDDSRTMREMLNHALVHQPFAKDDIKVKLDYDLLDYWNKVRGGEPALLRWYPVLINLLLLGLFALSLKIGPPLVERLARLREPELPAVAVHYTRQVTKVWALFFLGNGLITVALTLWAPLFWWTLYTGLISYGLIGLLFAGEWLVRQRVRRTA